MFCVRVPDPEQCENKNCKVWRAWFVERWEQLRQIPRQQLEQARREPVGVAIGSHHYAAPHQVRSYLAQDPCGGCLCPKDLCRTPCQVKRAWQEARARVM